MLLHLSASSARLQHEEAIKPNAAQKRWQELDGKMNRATRQIHLDIYNLLSYIEETSHE